MWSFFSNKFTVDALLKLMRSANEPPSDENLEAQKSELISLARDAKKEVLKQDSRQTGVIALPDVTPRTEKNPDATDWFVVGDLHSDYQSLSRILLKIYLRPGIDADKVRIIFLGDYVDRGDRPMQVLKLLLSLKKNWPDHFWLLRGNHESYEIQTDGTVASAVSPRDTIDLWQPHFGKEAFIALAELFALLPVAFTQSISRTKDSFSIGKEKILYAHGGIPRKNNLRLPLESPECREGLMWSDPELDKEEVINGPAKRFSFGRNDFLDFMTHHDFTLMVRGHEVRKNGFDLHDEVKGSGRRMLTIFSCGGVFNDPEQNDSNYKSDIVVPRFLHIQPNSTKDLPVSVEEVYRDDIYIAGNLGQYNHSLSDALISSIKGRLCESDGLGINLYSDPLNNDQSNEYDSNEFYVRMTFNADSEEKVIFKVYINNHMSAGTFNIDGLDLNLEVGCIIEKIQAAYPIFGKLPNEYFTK